jgi:hypothetical protein
MNAAQQGCKAVRVRLRAPRWCWTAFPILARSKGTEVHSTPEEGLRFCRSGIRRLTQAEGWRGNALFLQSGPIFGRSRPKLFLDQARKSVPATLSSSALRSNRKIEIVREQNEFYGSSR